MQAAARGARRRRRRHDGLAATDVALQQPQHGAAGAQIRIDFAAGAQLRLRQLKRQRAKEAIGEPLRIIDSPCGVRLHGTLQNLEAQVMSEQFLKRKAALCRMPPGSQFLGPYLTRRPMHVRERLLQRRQSERR